MINPSSFALLPLLAILVAAGCASAPVQPEGSRLIAAGHTEAGLAQLEQAARENPRQHDLRFEWLRQRELAAARAVAQAEAARARGDFEAAEAAYREALRVDKDHPRAAAGLRAMADERRHAQAVREADTLFGKRDLAAADAKLRAVLAENPSHADARNLLRRIADAGDVQKTAAPTLKAASGRKVTLEFKEANLKSVFEVIARTTGLNFVFDKDVRQDLKTTIVVRDTTVEDVVKLILATNQLDRKVLNDNTLLIYPRTPAKQRDYQELVVRSFYIANADVKQVLNMIRAVVKTRDIFIDEKLNLLVMKDTPEAVRLAEKLIAAQDLAEPEVTLEVEVLEVGSNRLKELGVRFPDKVSFQDPATVATGAGIMRAMGPLTGFISTPAVTLNLRQTDGSANVLANPRIRVKNHEKARIHIGDRVPVVTTTVTANVGVSASVNYLDVGLKLEVEPTIYLDGDVGIKVGLEVSNIVREVPTTGGGLAYQVGTRNAATVLRLKDGETQVLAGLIQDEERSTASKLPGFGDLPVLGRLFSSNLDTRGKTEIVLLITPRIVRNLAREGVKTEFFSGTEAAVGEPPLLLAATGPGALALSGSSAPVSVTAPPAPPVMQAMAAPATVNVVAPAQAGVGKEMMVSVTLQPHAAAASAQLELVYDPVQLAPVGGGTGTGTVPLEISRKGSGAARAEARFRVIAKTPGSVQLRAENLVVRDAAGGSVPVALPLPQTVSITE